jgi:serine/threonine protein phosphatase PrpC
VHPVSCQLSASAWFELVHEAVFSGHTQVGGVTRVNGNLNLSRAIGDLRYKGNGEMPPEKQIITAQVWSALGTTLAYLPCNVYCLNQQLRSALRLTCSALPQLTGCVCCLQPDVRRVQLTPADRFLLLACDGIWDVMTNQQVGWAGLPAAPVVPHVLCLARSIKSAISHARVG